MITPRILVAYSGKGCRLRLLVTGGAGFIGSAFARFSHETGRATSITVLDSLTYAADLSRLESVPHRLVVGSVADEALVEEEVKRSDLVVNFAAESHNDNSLVNPRLFFETNAAGVLNLVQACSKHAVRFHQVSTDEVFGDLPLESDAVFSSKSPFAPSSPYSASKAAGDVLVKAWVRSFNLRATISHCSNNYGQGQHPEKLIPNVISRISRGERPQIYGNGKHIRDWIHVDDHVEAIWKIIEEGQIGQTYLISAGDLLSNNEVVSLIINSMNSSVTPMYINDRPGHDLKYALDWRQMQTELGWSARRGKLADNIGDLLGSCR